MTDGRVARRYGLALFHAAKAHGMVDAVESDLELFGKVVKSDPRIHDFLVAPFTTRPEKIAILHRAFGDRITALSHQVLKVMIEKGREEELLGVQVAFTALRRIDEKVVSAKVESSSPLDEAQKAAIVEKLGLRLKRRVEAEFSVDPSLLGGVRVAYDSFILDGTVRGTLGQLRERLKYDLLKQN